MMQPVLKLFGQFRSEKKSLAAAAAAAAGVHIVAVGYN